MPLTIDENDETILHFLKELHRNSEGFETDKPTVKCTAFEDNEGIIQLATAPKLKPRTKHINIKYHHFKSEVGKTITFKTIASKDQLADIGTKPLAYKLFRKLRKRLIGW